MNYEVRITKRVGGGGLKSLPLNVNDRPARPAYRASSGTLMPVLLSVLLIVNMSGVAGAQQAQAATGTLRGAVSSSGPDGQSYNIPVASLKLTGTAQIAEASANDEGEYEFVGPAARRLHAGGERARVQDRRASPSPSARARLRSKTSASKWPTSASRSRSSLPAGASRRRRWRPPREIKRSTLQKLPLARERFTDALPLVPGVVRGPDGQINVKGGRPSQSGMTVNSSNVSDPVTGNYAINLPVEAVESVQVITNPYAAEYGNFTAGVTKVETRAGADKWQFQFQNFFPRLRRSGGHVAGLESITPRLAFGGPLVKDKVSFFQSFEYRFARTSVESLPQAERDTKLESFDSYTRMDWNIDPNNHLSTTLSLFPQKLGYVGLNTFNPREVTPDFRQRGFFWAVRESSVIKGSSLLESTFSVKQFDADVYPSNGAPA